MCRSFTKIPEEGEEEEKPIPPTDDEEVVPPETDEGDKEDVLPPQVDEENKGEVILPEENKNMGNANSPSNGNQNQNIVDSSNEGQENIEKELENVEDTIEIASLDETKDMNAEEGVIESIQGISEDEFSENIENMNSNEISKEENHIMIKVFIAITIIASITFVIARKKSKANKRL